MKLKKKQSEEVEELTSEEKEALSEDRADESEISTDLLNRATTVIATTFGLDDSYHVTAFAIKKDKVVVGVSNGTFDLQVGIDPALVE